MSRCTRLRWSSARRRNSDPHPAPHLRPRPASGSGLPARDLGQVQSGIRLSAMVGRHRDSAHTGSSMTPRGDHPSPRPAFASALRRRLSKPSSQTLTIVNEGALPVRTASWRLESVDRLLGPHQYPVPHRAPGGRRIEVRVTAIRLRRCPHFFFLHRPTAGATRA